MDGEKLSAVADLFACGETAGLEAAGLPDLKLLAKSDESDDRGDAAVRAKPFRKDDASVPVEPDNLDVAVERDREFVSLVRIVGETREKPIDFLRKSLAACIECRSIEGGVAVDAE